MKFMCMTQGCKGYSQQIELRAEQLTPVDLDPLLYQETGRPFFFTIPPVYCGYCGLEAQREEQRSDG